MLFLDTQWGNFQWCSIYTNANTSSSLAGLELFGLEATFLGECLGNKLGKWELMCPDSDGGDNTFEPQIAVSD